MRLICTWTTSRSFRRRGGSWPVAPFAPCFPLAPFAPTVPLAPHPGLTGRSTLADFPPRTDRARRTRRARNPSQPTITTRAFRRHMNQPLSSVTVHRRNHPPISLGIARVEQIANMARQRHCASNRHVDGHICYRRRFNGHAREGRCGCSARRARAELEASADVHRRNDPCAVARLR